MKVAVALEPTRPAKPTSLACCRLAGLPPFSPPRRVESHRIQLLPGSNLSVADAAALYRTFGNTRGSYGDLERTDGAVAIYVEPLEPSVPIYTNPLNPSTSNNDMKLALQLRRELNGLRPSRLGLRV